jgi:hypothetical protein
LLGNAVGWEGLYLVASIILLMFGRFIHLVGHTVEPMQPGVLDRTDQFWKLTLKFFGPKVILMVFIGYVAEFASRFPFWLFTVQIFILAQMQNWKPTSQISLLKAQETGRWITDKGFWSHPDFTKLYLEVQLLE